MGHLGKARSRGRAGLHLYSVKTQTTHQVCLLADSQLLILGGLGIRVEHEIHTHTHNHPNQLHSLTLGPSPSPLEKLAGHSGVTLSHTLGSPTSGLPQLLTYPGGCEPFLHNWPGGKNQRRAKGGSCCLGCLSFRWRRPCKGGGVVVRTEVYLSFGGLQLALGLGCVLGTSLALSPCCPGVWESQTLCSPNHHQSLYVLTGLSTSGTRLCLGLEIVGKNWVKLGGGGMGRPEFSFLFSLAGL